MGVESIQPAIVLVPFPAQGHVTPMLHLARAFAARGLATTVAVPDFIHRRIAGRMSPADANMALVPIPSGLADGDEPADFASILHAMEHHMPAHLERMLLHGLGRVACLVVDVLASWAVPVAARCGVPAAGFWPAMLASYRIVAAIPELMEKGFISESGTPLPTNRIPNDQDQVNQVQTIGDLQILPGQVELSTKELPWLVGDSASRKSRFAFWLQTLERAKCLRSILVNSFPGEAGDLDQRLPHNQHLLPIGPLLIANNEERTKGDVPNLQCKNPSMWQADSTCIDWLDEQHSGSVIYVSFGSWVGPIGPEKINELALGLEATGRPFLWVLKKDPTWRAGLPDRYIERVAGSGKVAHWAPQEDVLRHKAIGCYLTHCGWNSTIEAIQHGMRLLCYPISGDQFINCAYIVKMWGIGLKLSSTNQSEVKNCIGRIMEGKEGKHLQERVNELREKVMMGEARLRANRNLNTFVDEIKRDDLLLMQIYNIL